MMVNTRNSIDTTHSMNGYKLVETSRRESSTRVESKAPKLALRKLIQISLHLRNQPKGKNWRVTQYWLGTPTPSPYQTFLATT